MIPQKSKEILSKCLRGIFHGRRRLAAIIKEKVVRQGDAHYCARDFDPPLADVRRRLLLVGRTLDTMMPPSKNNPRAEYRLRENERANLSPTLAAKFPGLKSLRGDLVYFDRDGVTQTGALKYKANIAHARSVLSFACQNGDCLAGGFDLSSALAEAVAGRRKSAAGELRCPGTFERPKRGRRPCLNLIRYKFTLGYV